MRWLNLCCCTNAAREVKSHLLFHFLIQVGMPCNSVLHWTEFLSFFFLIYIFEQEFSIVETPKQKRTVVFFSWSKFESTKFYIVGFFSCSNEILRDTNYSAVKTLVPWLQAMIVWQTHSNSSWHMPVVTLPVLLLIAQKNINSIWVLWSLLRIDCFWKEMLLIIYLGSLL